MKAHKKSCSNPVIGLLGLFHKDFGLFTFEAEVIKLF